jgi:hypothetical protein
MYDDRIKASKQLFETNMESIKCLVHFLKKYSEGLKKDQPLKAQRHKLEFVLPCVFLGFDEVFSFSLIKTDKGC